MVTIFAYIVEKTVLLIFPKKFFKTSWLGVISMQYNTVVSGKQRAVIL